MGSLSEITTNLFGTKVTVKDINERFKLKVKNLITVSDSTIKRRLKDYLKLSYKRWGILNKSFWTWPKINEMLESSVLQLELDRLNFKLICIDEFRFSSESSTEYGWTNRGISGHHFLNYSSFNMSFMIGFSFNAIEGVVATKGSFNSKKFRKNLI